MEEKEESAGKEKGVGVENEFFKKNKDQHSLIVFFFLFFLFFTNEYVWFEY